MWLEKVVAFVWTGWGCDESAVKVDAPGLEELLLEPLIMIFGLEGDCTEIGIKVSS